MQLPNEPTPGKPINASWGQRVVRYLKSLTLRSSADIRVNHGPNGITLALVRSSGGSASNKHPLQPVQSAPTKIRIRYGLIHADVPSIDDTEITAQIGDEANPEITITQSGKLYAGVDLAEDTYKPENPIIAFAEAVPDDVDRLKAYREMASVTFADGKITNITPVVRGNMDVASCGGVLNYWDMGGGA